jgi:hypothetical protein
MAWFETYTDTNKIVEGKRHWEDSFTVDTPGIGPVVWTRNFTEETYRYVGMTYAAAVTAAAAIEDLPLVTATVKRTGAAGSYSVEVSEITRGDWAD